MNHRIKGRKLGRTSKHLEAMLANQATSLFYHGRIKTTHSKCKELRRLVDRLITTAKTDTVHNRRQVSKVIRDRGVVQKLFNDIAPEYVDRPGGYTQIFQLGPRKNDGAEMSYIQLVDYKPKAEENE